MRCRCDHLHFSAECSRNDTDHQIVHRRLRSNFRDCSSCYRRVARANTDESSQQPRRCPAIHQRRKRQRSRPHCLARCSFCPLVCQCFACRFRFLCVFESSYMGRYVPSCARVDCALVRALIQPQSSDFATLLFAHKKSHLGTRFFFAFRIRNLLGVRVSNYCCIVATCNDFWVTLLLKLGWKSSMTRFCPFRAQPSCLLNSG